MRFLGLAIAILASIATHTPAAVVVVSNSLAAMDRGGWHTNGPHIAWPSSNGIHWASITNGRALGTTTSITTNGGVVTTQTVQHVTATTNTTAFYPASNLFIYRTNLVFSTAGGVLTQAFDAVLSAPNAQYSGVAFPYSNDYRFLITVTNAATNIVFDLITKTIAFTNYGVATNASMDARQVRIWDTYMALLERAHVQAFDYPSVDDQMDGSNYPLRVGMTVPWATFYHQPWVSMLSEVQMLFYFSWPDGAWLDPAYMTNLLDRVNSITNPAGINGSNVKDVFPIGGDSAVTSQWFDVYTAYNLPTNYATWLPANLSWLETQPRARVETNRFLTTTTNGLISSTVVWTNAPIAVGQVSTNYGLDTLRRLISATRYSVTDSRFSVTVWNTGLGTSTNSYAEAIANAMAAPTDYMAYFGATLLSSYNAGWETTVWRDGADYKAKYEEKIGRLYCGALPETVTHQSGDYLIWGNPPSDEIAHTGDVYAWSYVDSSTNLFNQPQILLQSFPSTTNCVMSGSIYGRGVTSSDFPATEGTTGEWYQVSFAVLDYGITNGFIYK